MSVPEAFIKVGDYYKTHSQIIGKYSNYNTVISKGSLFYKSLLTEEKYLPDAYRYDVPAGSTVINYPVNMSTTYANSIMPENYINIYFKAIIPASENEGATEDQIMFGKFIRDIEVLSVKDSQGQHVFENTDEVRTPAYMLFALPEEQALLIKKAEYFTELSDVSYIEFIIIPRGSKYTAASGESVTAKITSEQLEEYIKDKTKEIKLNEEKKG